MWRGEVAGMGVRSLTEVCAHIEGREDAKTQRREGIYRCWG
jgi:hypothetical protein